MLALVLFSDLLLNPTCTARVYTGGDGRICNTVEMCDLHILLL